MVPGGPLRSDEGVSVLAVDRALAAVPHAFGGALALAYWAEPRATVDIDVNVFVPTEQVDAVLGPLADLSPEHLTVGKAVFDRPKDWVDIEAMVTLGTTFDVAEVLRWVGRIAGDTDPRYGRVAAVLT